MRQDSTIIFLRPAAPQNKTPDFFLSISSGLRTFAALLNRKVPIRAELSGGSGMVTSDRPDTLESSRRLEDRGRGRGTRGFPERRCSKTLW
mmetsp:Transcript_3436/g.5234  ORF Transcript_3436/g.5234 Transcript_3436/m.5234 type:complete len:91 (-) Transcript_3436:1193-1465(-)